MQKVGVVAIILALFLGVAAAQHRRVVERLKVGRDIEVFHADVLELRGGAVNIVGPQDSEGHDGEDVASLSGMLDYPFEIKRSYGLNNGLAGISIRDGQRFIVWDPIWGAGGFQFMVLGHEIGHHICGHTIPSFRGSPQEMELEADRYAGAALKRLFTWKSYEGPIDKILYAMERNLSREGSATHPPVAQRIAAVRAGYLYGSPCEKSVR